MRDSKEAVIKMGAQKTQSFGSGMNGQSLNSSVLKKSWGSSLQKEAQICVVGKVFRAE
jgi:hypothetical protein